MSELKQNGTIKLINDLQTFDSGFQKREFVVTTDGQYPQDIKFECTQTRCELLDNLSVGQSVDVHFNIKGNEYNGRYFVNLQAWKIETVESAAPPPVAPGPQTEESEDDLPF